MTTHFEQELEKIKAMIFRMADLAIEAIYNSVESLRTSDVELARKVLDNDSELDRLEMDSDDECIRVLVTRQPAAIDLRLVLAMLKINTDLERIGDLSTNIAKETIRLDGRPTLKALIDIPRMAELAIEMIKDTFTAFTTKDAALAREVIKRDSEIDELNLQVYRELFTYMAEKPAVISQGLGVIMVSKHIERIGDHVTNIAERAVYYIEGVDIRHCSRESV